MFISVVYRQPDDRVGNNRSTETEFRPVMEKLNNALLDLPNPTPNIFICGDFNLPHADWSNNTILSGCSSSEQNMIQMVRQLQQDHFLTQHISSPTHVDGGLLDLVFSNNSAVIHSSRTIQPLRSTSDHFVVEVSTPLMCAENVDEDTRRPLIAALDNLNFHSNDIEWEEMAATITQRVESGDFATLSPNEHLERLMKILIDVAYKFVPCKTTSRHTTRTNIPRERRILMRKRRKLSHQFAQATSDDRKSSLRTKLIRIELLIQKSHFGVHSRKEQLAVKAIKTNSKFFFSYAKQFSKTRSSIGPLLTEKMSTLCYHQKWLSSIHRYSAHHPKVVSMIPYRKAALRSMEKVPRPWYYT